MNDRLRDESGEGAFPRVSVIVPVYNREEMVVRAVRSVLAQTFADFEVLVVDDASTDGSAEAVERIADARVRCLRSASNQGPSASRNAGFREARGELIAFLDSDDEWLPEKLQRQVALLGSAAEDVGVVYTGRTLVGEEGISTVRRPVESGDVYQQLLDRNFVATSSVLVRRECLEAVGLFDERMRCTEDLDLWLRLARRYHFAVISDPLVVYHTGRPDQLAGDACRRNEGRRQLHAKLRSEVSPWLLYLRTAAKQAQLGAELLERGDRQGGRCALIASLLRWPFGRRTWRLLARSLGIGPGNRSRGHREP